MNFDCGRKHDLMGRGQAFFVGERFQVEFGGLADVGKGLFDCRALGLTTLQFRAPCVAAVLVLFNYHADSAGHIPSFYRFGYGGGPSDGAYFGSVAMKAFISRRTSASLELKT